MAGSEITLDTPDGAMPAFRATPDREVKGGIVVVQEAFGVTPHIEEVCLRLAAAGWLAVAPALFHRQGSPVLAYDQFDRVRPVMQTLTAEGIDDDMDAAFEHLDGEGFAAARTGTVGFCMGGSVSLAAAGQRSVGAAVTYYGGGLTEGRFGYPPLIEVAPNLTTPWMGHFGDLDKGIPSDQVDDLARAAAASSVPTEVHRYADADHGFNCDDRPAVYNPTASALAWERTLAWFDAHIATT